MASVPHLTLRQIATAARVHVSTVSLALRDDPRLRSATRRRIQNLARRLGYAAGPLTQSLSRYRSSTARSLDRPRVAWITHHPTIDGWKKLKTAQQSFLGAHECAEALGYELETVWVGAEGMTVARATQLLRAQKTIGLLVAPAAQPRRHLQLPWKDFATVSIGLSLSRPHLHLTAHHHCRSARLAVEQLNRRGYRRIGLVLLARANERVEHGWLGGYLASAGEQRNPDFPPPLILARWDAMLIRRWYQRHRPDAIVTRHLELRETLSKMGVAVPDDVGLAFLSVPDRSGAFAGIDENARAVGAGAMAMVADMITRGEKGIPVAPHRLLFEGAWIDGRTVRPGAATANA